MILPLNRGRRVALASPAPKKRGRRTEVLTAIELPPKARRLMFCSPDLLWWDDDGSDGERCGEHAIPFAANEWHTMVLSDALNDATVCLAGSKSAQVVWLRATAPGR